MNATNAFAALLALPLVTAPVIYMIGRAVTRSGRAKRRNPSWWLALLALAATAVPLYYAGRATLAGETVSLLVGAVALRLDGLGLLLAVAALGLGIFATLFSARYMAAEVGVEKYYAVVNIMVGAMIGLGCATDIFNLWVWFEAMALASLLLVAFYHRQAGALEAGVKYLVQSAIGSVFILLGIALVFSQTGTLELAGIATAAQSAPHLLLAAGALFVIGFGIKAALVPLHTWLPDAHSQAPSGVSALLSGVLIEAGLVALLRGLGSLHPAAGTWGGIFLAFGALNMLVGNLMALRQTELKRLLAYSSISHVGYMLVGLGVAIAFHQANGAAGGLFHLMTHAMMKGLAFLAAGALLYALYLAKGSHGPLTVEDLSGAATRYPVVAAVFSIAVLGLGGVPPMAGFMSKWQILVAGAQTGNTIVFLLVIFTGLNSILSLGYYAPLVNRLYRRTPSAAIAAGAPVPVTMLIPLCLLAAGVLLLGVWPGLVDGLTNAAAASVLAAFGG